MQIYQPGDRVRIRADLIPGYLYPCGDGVSSTEWWTRSHRYAGDFVTISRYAPEYDAYFITEVHGQVISDEMIDSTESTTIDDASLLSVLLEF